MVYLSLGTNLGERADNLARAMVLLNQEGVTVIRASSVYETGPRDVFDQPLFLNMVLECETRLFPMQLLAKVLSIERRMGRDRGPSARRRGPRLIDIDILLYRSVVMKTARLTVPHPRMLERHFVLAPLLELVPTMRDQATNRRLAEFLPGVSEQQIAKKALAL